MTATLTRPLDTGRKRNRLHPDPLRRLVDATLARAHLQQLNAWGYTDMGIANIAGVSPTTVGEIRTGVHLRVVGDTEKVLLGVGPYPEDGHPTVPSVLVARRLRALAALGWSQLQIADELGVRRGTVHNWTTHPTVQRSTYLLVDRTFERLSMTLGPSASARTRALNRGWHPPLAWDDIDHPDETVALGEAGEDRRRDPEPDPAAVSRALVGDRSVRLTAGDRAAVLDHALRLDWKPRELAARTGWTQEAAEQALTRHKRTGAVA